MPEFRCTRNALYDDGGQEDADLSVRQGHYIIAQNEEQALEEMRARFPKEVEAGFTVHPWKSFREVVPINRDQYCQPKQEQPQS
ncbi:hypothetical protein NG796_24585 [Laspinema sp. A4]|uniref:hypothetical protein n=1 Tax=Laspinema sp. D2d TaxID=2953686 RepID=UPI0021BB32DE|nr:hypothetical protein [Laspinema sp. D2d]MCT7986453.1 hypothetical protein [Laspinema sp. D2d]